MIWGWLGKGLYGSMRLNVRCRWLIGLVYVGDMTDGISLTQIKLEACPTTIPGASNTSACFYYS